MKLDPIKDLQMYSNLPEKYKFLYKTMISCHHKNPDGNGNESSMRKTQM